MAVKTGDTVKVHYTGKLDDGTVFDSSRERDPLEFTLGQGQLIPGFEKAVEGLEQGESTSITLEPEQAYGPRDEEAIVTVERSRLPEGMDPQPGQRLQMQTPEGQAVPVTVTETSDDNVTLDANHPLAGKSLNFEIEVIEVAG